MKIKLHNIYLPLEQYCNSTALLNCGCPEKSVSPVTDLCTQSIRNYMYEGNREASHNSTVGHSYLAFTHVYQVRRGNSFIFQSFWPNFLQTGNYYLCHDGKANCISYLLSYFTAKARYRERTFADTDTSPPCWTLKTCGTSLHSMRVWSYQPVHRKHGTFLDILKKSWRHLVSQFKMSRVLKYVAIN